MKPSSSEHSCGRESVTVAAWPSSFPVPVVVLAFHPRHFRLLTRRWEPSQRRTSPLLGSSTPRLQLTTARIRRLIGSLTVSLRVHCPESPTGSVYVAVTVN